MKHAEPEKAALVVTGGYFTTTHPLCTVLRFRPDYNAL